ncbi:MAG: hypothetical protein JKY54_16635 [Flavobacteriales bacterium]|nr:hypothetical protein [Flavobacteriales bacterium]
MTDQKHIIKRQVIELGLTSSENAFQIQDDVSRNFKNVIIPLLQKIFDEISSPDEVLKIDTLCLDLGSIDVSDLSHQLSTNVKEQIKEVLIPQIELKRSGSKLPSEVEKRFLDQEEQVVGLHIKSKNLSEIEKVLHFLKTGTLPWWGNKGDYFTLEKSIQKLLLEDPKNLIICLKEQSVFRNYQNRLINNCSDFRLLNLLQKINPNAKTVTTKGALFIQALKKKNRLDFGTRQKVWNYTFDIALRKDLGTTDLQNEDAFLGFLIALQNDSTIDKNYTNELTKSNNWKRTIKRLTDALSRSNSELKPAWKTIFLDAVLDKNYILVDKISNVLQNATLLKGDEWDKLISEVKKRGDKGLINTLSTILDKGHSLKKESWENQLKEAVNNNTIIAPKEEFLEEIYIENAGLILCWNYLSIFFKEFKLVKDKEFVDENAAQRAVHILQYMATKEENVSEHELALNKILCGLPVDNPISIDFKLTDLEKEECENLLQAVLDNWKVLKNTSPQSLRETFLIKEGILTKRGSEWHLRLERTAVDMLIDKLPWNISMINLPWNDNILHVTW